MDTTNDIAEFLTSRRARITPEQAGLPTYGKRRVPGLRREEVASLAGDLDLSYETMELAADAGLNLTVYTAEAGSASQQALDILASWTATLDEADTAGAR
jgi:hypothetical protein